MWSIITKKFNLATLSTVKSLFLVSDLGALTNVKSASKSENKKEKA